MKKTSCFGNLTKNGTDEPIWPRVALVWHTECVAMIREFLSDKENDKFEIDIHAGGIDLLFPHHENEASQCRCAYHKNLSKYWMHNGFIKVNNEKMSKSLNNSFFVKDALKKRSWRSA